MEALIEGAELDEDELDQIASGYRVVGEVKQYAKGEKEAYLCPFSKNPKRMHKYVIIEQGTDKGLFSNTDYKIIRCEWCGRQKKVEW